jgi:exosortase/archaeosortase family protein
LILAYAAAVLAYPATRRQWWVGIAWGALGLFVFNTIRLACLGWIGAHQPSYFEPAHEIWWQAASATSVCIGWFLWLRIVVLRAGGAAPGGRRIAET